MIETQGTKRFLFIFRQGVAYLAVFGAKDRRNELILLSIEHFSLSEAKYALTASYANPYLQLAARQEERF
jgi:hypothetical protein